MLTKEEKLYALSWKGHELGVSYSQLVNQCPAEEMERIYAEYEQILKERREAERLRLAEKARRKSEGRSRT